MIDVLSRSYELGDIKAGYTLANIYEKYYFNKDYFIKIEEIYKHLINDKDEKMAVVKLAELYLYSDSVDDEDKLSIFAKLVEVSTLGGSISCRATKIFEDFGFNDLAIDSLEKTRIHIIENNIDYYDIVDDEGVMKYFYPRLAENYYAIGDKEHGDYYLEEGLKANIGEAYIYKGYKYYLNNEFDKAKELYLSKLDTCKMAATFALGELYSNEEYKDYDLVKAFNYYKESKELGHQLADEELLRIAPLLMKL